MTIMLDRPAHTVPRIRQGVSSAQRPTDAARELHHALAGPEVALVLFFCAPEYATPGFAAEMGRLFEGVPVVGCTSAGEIGPGGYHENSVSAVSFARPDFEAVAGLLVRSGDARGRSQRGNNHSTCAASSTSGSAAGPAMLNCFALLLDRQHDPARGGAGLARGQRAGRHPRPRRRPPATRSPSSDSAVFCGGRFHAEGAVLILVATNRPIRTFRSQHFVASDLRMVVTGAEPERRVVTELDAEPAVEVYARLVGCPVAELTPMVFATHPLVVRLGGAEYVRSIQKANPDGSLSFYCAIDEGLVLTLSEGHDLLRRIEGLFDDIQASIGIPDVVIGFECVLNRLEAERSQIKHRLSRLHAANNVTGFASFGEQWGSMHVNQTFTGIAIGRGAWP